jgi:hypothetical protein
MMLIKYAHIDSCVRAKLEELGVDAVRIKLGHVTGVRSFGKQDVSEEDLGEGVKASGRQMREWLSEKIAREALWVRVRGDCRGTRCDVCLPGSVLAHSLELAARA